MKIQHKSRRAVPPPTQVAELIQKLMATPNEHLAHVLGEIDVWTWARSDLNAWIKVLNRFDSILEDIIRVYDIDNLQNNSLNPADKAIVMEILRVERLLLENSTNRKMFCSYDRINSLLAVDDLDILVLALKLMLRPAQQYSAQPSVTQALSIPTGRLLSLSKRWPHLREYGIDLVDLTTSDGNAEVDQLPSDAREVNFSFYRTDQTAKEAPPPPEPSNDTSPVKTPVASASTAGAVMIHIDEASLQAKPMMQVLAETVHAHSVPESEKFELLSRIRAAYALAKGNRDDREKLVIARLLSIAVYGHTHPESQASSSLFLFEPDMIPHMAELLHVDKGISVHVQTAAIAALDALARYRGKIQEVLTAVNAGVNHGVLMALLRKTVGDIAQPSSTTPQTFVEALLTFVTFIASHASGGNMVVGAGLIPLLIQLLENRLPHRLHVLSKAMQLVDNVLYSFTNAFNLFCSSRGVETLVERISYEIELDIKQHGDLMKSRDMQDSSQGQGEIPVARAAVLKHILRSLHRMMQTSGSSEGLRGLIDTSILKSIKRIIEYRGLFGPSVLPIAINIMATFVHNEPSALGAIQEAGLPESFYRLIEIGLEPAIEVIQAIPNALGALCLNEVGQRQLAGRPSIIPSLFTIFTSDRHLKVMLEKENAVLMGTAIDELIRHHPHLKQPVFQAISATLSKIEELGLAYKPPTESRHWYSLIPAPVSGPSSTSSHSDVTMLDLPLPTPASSDRRNAVPDFEAGPPPGSEESSSKSHDNHIVSFIDILNRFLEGLFQHVAHCKDFVATTDGLARLGRLTALPCLPYDFANSVSSDSMVQVMRTLIEVSTNETLALLSRQVSESLEATKDFWGEVGTESKLLPLIEFQATDSINSNYRLRNLVTLHIRITLLSDVFATAGYAHGRAAISLLQNLMSNTSPEVIADLGTLHRASVWENILLKKGLLAKGIDVPSTPIESPSDGHPSKNDSLPPAEGSSAPLAGSSGAPNGVPGPEQVPAATSESRSHSSSSRDHNAAAVKHLTHGLPGSLAPFFQAMIKMFNARRTPDAAQKQQIAESSKNVADILLKHLQVPVSGDKQSIYTYYNVVLGLTSIFLVDERPTANTLHTVQLLAFYRAGGLEAIFNICDQLIASGLEILASGLPHEEIHQEATLTWGGVEGAMHLLHQMLSSKPLFESPQTQYLTTRDRNDTDPDYFEPHNFLVRLRLATLPWLQKIWDSTWLLQAPLPVCRVTVQTILVLVNGENEENRGEPDGGAIGGPMGTLAHMGSLGAGLARPPPDESRIRQLTDMGFPRSAAQRALSRAHNNVTAATEILLAHSFPFPADPDPEPEPEAPETTAVLEFPPSPGAEATPETQESVGTPRAESPADTEMRSPPGKSAEDWRKELNEAREPLRAGVGRRALTLVDEHLSLIFDLHVAFVRPQNSHQLEAVSSLVDDVKSFSPFAYDVREQPLANRCRLLALVLSEAPSSVNAQLRSSLLESLLALLLSNPLNAEQQHPTIPKWMAAHLLVTESLLTLADEPKTITLPKPGEEVVPQPISNGPALNEARSIIFDFCMRLLAVPDLPSDELLSVLRLLVSLTRHREFSATFVSRDGVALLFNRLRTSPVNGSSSYIASIIRHLVEDAGAVERIMRLSIKRYLTQPRVRPMDVPAFVRNCNAMALRDPETFVKVTQSLLILKAPYSPTAHLYLKEAPTEQAEASSSNSGNDAVLHFLISELMNACKVTKSTAPTVAAKEGADISTEHGQEEATEEPTMASPPADKEHQKDSAQYASFLMQCITELLFSYDSCKVSFLTYSPKKRTQTPGKDSSSKYRTATVNFLLSELCSYGTIITSAKDTRDQSTLCNWSMSVLVALCVDTASMQEAKDVPPELVGVRKFVLEAINRAIKDLSGNEEGLEARYGRLLALVDLCHRLLTVRFNTSTRKQPDELPTHIAKVMLEKNFVATLTNALSEVDLNYPNVKALVASILKPLEYLSKVAIKMSRSTNRTKDDAEESDSASSVETDEDEAETNVREETPDLYRNSALGMYGGEMDDGTYVDAEDDEMDMGDDDVDEDDEMDFADQTDSDDTSVTDEEGEDDEMGDSEVDTADDWDQDENGEDEDNLVPNEDDDEEDEDDEEDDEEAEMGIGGIPGVTEDDAEMMWHDIGGEDDPEIAADERDDDDAPVHIIHEDDEDAPDMASDEEEELSHELDELQGGDAVGDIFGLEGEPHNARGVFMPRRHSRSVEDGLHVFGRPRAGGPAAPEATTHPLLIDSNGRGPPQARSLRHPHLSPGSNDLIQTIEQLVGGGAVHLFQQVMSRQRGGGPETIRLDVPAGAIVSLDRAFAQHRRPHGMVSGVRLDRAPKTPPSGRELDPLLTLQRWTEENKIIHGDFVIERVGKLSDHVTLALLPAAIQAEKEEKAKEEAAAAERERVAREEAEKENTEREKAEKEKVEKEKAEKEQEEAAEKEKEEKMDSTPEAEGSAPAAPLPETALDQATSSANEVDTEMTDATRAVDEAGPSGANETNSAPERVTVMIHGSAIDITDTGIDPTFLEALPDDMREEVLNQHVRDQRAARVERAPDSQISEEFLNALPPELRVEIIQQEAIERTRRRNDQAPLGTGVAADTDPASFIAGLNPDLRQAVLLDQEDGFIQALPPHLAAEADEFRAERRRHTHTGRPLANRGVAGSSNARKVAPQHDAIHLLDKQGLAVLIRLLFFPQVLKKTLLFKVLLNLCENAKTRTELFNLLLNILQDGTGDLASVDKSFSQMSFRPSKPSKSPGKQKAPEYFPPIALPNTQGETVPDLIAQRCLEALTFIVSSNQTSSLFFLTEHELPAGLRRSSSKKGKGKEKQMPQSHYPIVLLLSLLDRQSLLRTPSIMESVVGLLATVTRPLTNLKDRKASEEAPKTTVPQKSELSQADSTAMITDSAEPPPQPPITVDTSETPAANPPSSTPAPTTDVIQAPPVAAVEEQILLSNPPQIPHPVLRLIVNILTVGECSGRTFQQSLALIQHLSCLPDARDVIAQELKTKAQEFGQELFGELDELVNALQNLQGDVLVSSVATRFSAPSSVQAKLLRVLKTIDYMYTPKQNPAADDEDTGKVQAIYESFHFSPLWKRLGDCLAIIEEKPDTEHVATVLLPLIEALMVVCKYVGSKLTSAAPARAIRGSMSPKSPTTPRESMEDLFVAFTDSHRKILNLMVRNNPSLMSGSFSLLVHNPRVLDFDNKRNYFTQQLHKRPHPREHYGALQLNVRRARVFEDSFQHLQRRTGDQIKYGKLSIRFYDEEGVDAGGLTREWFQILARQMFDPNNALFQPCAADKLTYQPNKNSWVNPEHLSFFKFVGRVIGKAIYDGRLLDAYFARSLYRQLLGKPVDYKDVEWVDPEYYNSLCWILENDPTPLDLNFSVEADEFGVNRIVPLKENGESITVTQENKREFVQLSAQYRLYSSIKDQIEAFSTGFYEIVPKDLITIFNEQELELLISGTPDIDVDEWRSATEYNGYTSSEPNIVWWWRALKSFTRDERAKVLSFATGTSRVPLNGFGDLQGVQGVQKFSIHRAYGASDRLPSAHTCFNQIDLPQYSSYDMLRQQLLTAISEGAEGFGFV